MAACKVSVIIPVYQAQRYLRQCLDSVTGQTLKEIEIICVDDGSVDDSARILEEYAARDDRIRVISQENAGAGAARNRGLSEASGEYLSFLDADDFFEPDMLMRAYEKARISAAQIVVYGADRYRDDTGSFQKMSWSLRKNALPPYRPMDCRTFTDNVFKVFVGWAWDKLFEREFILRHGLLFQEQRTSNDLLFVFMAIVLAERIETVDEVLAHQRCQNPDSLSSTREKSWQCFYEALRALKERLEHFGRYRELEQDYVNYALHFSLWNLHTIQGEKKRELYQRLRKKWFKDLGIAGRRKSYFYDLGEYRQYVKIMRTSWRRYEKSE
ncbi:MAG: glycosyltransferase family 2 protein [Dorea sp.]|nr:glycosyltransferase family 2 protein [Dorea sp.]